MYVLHVYGVCRSVVQYIGRSLEMSCCVYVPIQMCTNLYAYVLHVYVLSFLSPHALSLYSYVPSVRLTFWPLTFSHEMPPHLYVPSVCTEDVPPCVYPSVCLSLGVHVSFQMMFSSSLGAESCVRIWNGIVSFT